MKTTTGPPQGSPTLVAVPVCSVEDAFSEVASLVSSVRLGTVSEPSAELLSSVASPVGASGVVTAPPSLLLSLLEGACALADGGVAVRE